MIPLYLNHDSQWGRTVPLYTTCARPQLSQGRMLMVGSRAAWTSSLLATRPERCAGSWWKLWGFLVGKPMGKPNEICENMGKTVGVLLGVELPCLCENMGKTVGFLLGFELPCLCENMGKTVGVLLGFELPCLCENMGKPMGKPRKKLLWTVQVKQSRKNTLQVMKKNWHLSGK